MTLFSSDDDRWRAISTRDATADGIFVYGVRTTRIYCRPNCKARLARRANVVYFVDIGTAEAEGYRACKRCKPAALGVMPEDEAVARIRSLVAAAANSPDAHGTRNPDGSMQKRGAARLATQARVSRWHFHRKFKQVTGMTPRAYLKKREAESLALERATQTAERSDTSDSRTPIVTPHPTPIPSDLPLLPLDEISDWFDFGTLMGFTQGSELDAATLEGKTVDFGSAVNFDEYLDCIDPCLIQSSG